ncbi:MAG: L-threonine 3-dehydrogenase [Caldisericia bacterium]|jgi:nucleoside-diphosphate-sugar epimerase|nr:L-threonine 3-dehydrogenase [Caldisericia bacterium]
MSKILVTGATGQIGSELTLYLREIFGSENVIAAGHKREPSKELKESGPFIFLDTQNYEDIERVVKNFQIDTIYHLSAILSAKGEESPMSCWNVNMNSLINVLEIGRNYKCKIFYPSSIAVFGPSSPKENTPQETIIRPTTMYGITKLTGELLCEYYYNKYGVDTRGVRYPGLISYVTPPGGGTTDYAVEIFYEAIKNKRYKCFLKEDTYLPMMYMPDAIKAAVDLMEADSKKLIHRASYNIQSMSFSPKELYLEIKKYIPEFEIEYEINPIKQCIADSWPKSIDSTCAKEEWGFNPKYSFQDMVKDMIEKLTKKLLGGDYAIK